MVGGVRKVIMPNCTICEGPFDLEKEGGITGAIGMLPVAFCPTCKAGIYDFADQMWGIAQEEEE